MTSEFDAFERRQEITERRMAHLIGDTGLARFEHHPYVAVCERFERGGDRLYEFHEIMTWVIALDPQLTRERVTTLFVQSVKHGGFGWRPGQHRVVANLINLHNFGSSVPRGQYFLRSTSFRIGENPRPWRSTRLVWVQWLRAQSLPIPIELASGITIEGEVVGRGGQPALPSPPAEKAEPTTKPPPASRRGAARLRANQALTALYPDGMPAKSIKEITNEVNKYLKENGLPKVSDDTAGRVIKELQSPQKPQKPQN